MASEFMARLIKTPTGDFIKRVLGIYEQGFTIDALREAETFAPLKDWGGARQCVLAARIAVNAGAPRLAARLSVRAWHTDKAHPDSQLQFSFQLSEYRGPLAAWRAMRGWKTSPDATTGDQAELLAAQARVTADLRDFAAAEKLLGRAETLCADRAWIRLQRAHLLEMQDRVEEALEISRAATALHSFPFYRPGVQTTAHLLQLLDRDEDAIDLLQKAGATIQNGPVAGQLYGILSENGRWSEAEDALTRYAELSPLLEPRLGKWIAAQRARVAYHLGKRTEAISFAREVDDKFHKNFAQNLETAVNGGGRVQLGVSFVRQHFKTCAPATLAALGRYWRLPAEHLKLAESMCYDGTPHWQQREWAEQNGWFVREFRVTHEEVVTLIDRGIPFAISTVQATSAHMQAMVGYDRVRGTVLMRDPGQPYIVEAFAEPFFQYNRSFGPHGMIFLPAAELGRLDGVKLPDAEIYDDYHRFTVRLRKHDRAEAAGILQAMTEKHGEQLQVWEARLDLATYDANVSEQLRMIDKLLEPFPNCPARVLRRLGCLNGASRSERIEYLQTVCQRKETDPVLYIEFARALGEDARRATEAAHWLKRALRFRPMDSNAMVAQADLLWTEGAMDEATELYHFAATLEGYREHLYQSWFSACRRTRRTKEAMAILEDRFQRFGTLSEQPGLTLAWAWQELDQPQRAREIYSEAARRRPGNGHLLLNAARLEAQLRNKEGTEKFLEEAKDKVRKTDWLRARAEIADMCLDKAVSLQASREILESEPLALDAQGAIARTLAQLEGKTAALAHLKAACAQFPHHYGLQRLLADWSRDESKEEAEAAARELLRIDPLDAWARRELSVILIKNGREEEALREAKEAAEIEPRNSYSFSVLGHVYNQCKKPVEARKQYRRAVELSVDNTNAQHQLLDLAQTDQERKSELAFVEGQLIRQFVNGDGLLAFRDLAQPVLEPATLLESLRTAHRERPDLWHAWSSLASQLGHLNRLDESLTIAKQASERFPHLPHIWLDLAKVHQWRKETVAEIAAAEHAFEMNPGWTRATLALTDALERNGKLDASRTVFKRALNHSRNDAQLHTYYAYLLWRLPEPDAALGEVEQALRIAPGYEWAWDLLQNWAVERGEADRAGNFARKLTAERPGEMRVWLMLARILEKKELMPERLSAIERALALSPRSTEVWDLKAELLAIAERFEEAIQAARDGALASDADVHVLRGREAWIEARRRRRPEAVKIMRQVLAENAHYVWGWNQLAHWLIEQEAVVEAAAALETLQRLRPHDAWVSRQLGFLKLKEGDRASAQKYFSATLQLAPTDSYAAQKLFDLQLKSADLQGAAATLQTMQIHQPGAVTLATEILLHLRKGNKQAARAVLEKLCASADPDAWPVNAAADAYSHAGQANKAIRILKRATRSAACNPQAAAAAIRLLVNQKKPYRALFFFFGLEPGEAQRRAAVPLVHGLADCRAKLAFRWLFWRRRQSLAQDDEVWGKVGYALSLFSSHKKTTRWLADWRTRQDVQPWMLFNLCLGLRQLGKYEESSEVARYAIEKWGHREGSADLRLFLAVEDALAGDIDRAQEHLKQITIREKVAYDQDLLALAKALVEFQQTPADERAKHFPVIREQLAKRFSETRVTNVSPDIRRTFHRTAKVFIQKGGGWRARLWFGWRLNWQWLLVPLIPTLLFPPVLIGFLVWLSRRK